MKWVKQYGEWTELYHKHGRDCYECQFKENGFGSISINENNNTATTNLLQKCGDLPLGYILKKTLNLAKNEGKLISIPNMDHHQFLLLDSKSLLTRPGLILLVCLT